MAEVGASQKKPGPKSITIREVAQRTGVSVATVSRVFNGSPTVDPVLAERVQAAIAELNYQPSRIARILAGHASTLIGLLVPDMQNPFYLDLIRGVEEVAQQQGYLVVVCNTLENAQKEANYLEMLACESIAGAIVVPTQKEIAGIEHLRKRQLGMRSHQSPDPAAPKARCPASGNRAPASILHRRVLSPTLITRECSSRGSQKLEERLGEALLAVHRLRQND